jgi:hypothetical protein
MPYIQDEVEKQVRMTGIWLLIMGSVIALGWLLHVHYYFLENDSGFIRLTYNFRAGSASSITPAKPKGKT